MRQWRRVSDWKASVKLVWTEQVGPEVLAAEGWVTPAGQLRGLWPGLAALAEEHGFARVEDEVAERLRAQGARIVEVGYHRVSDGYLYRELGPGLGTEAEVDAGALLALLRQDGTDDVRDDLAADLVDALLRIHSKGDLMERAVMVAAQLPPLGPPRALDAEAVEALEALEALGPRGLPDASEAWVDEVAEALARLSPHPGPEPHLEESARRGYIKKASALGGAALLVAVASWTTWPIVAVFAVPLATVCFVVVALHAAALAQERRARGGEG